MKFGEKYEQELVNRMSGKKIMATATYKRTEWKGYHTDKEGDGLWAGDRQIIGTCDFSVRGCRTEKAAKAKIRRYVSACA